MGKLTLRVLLEIFKKRGIRFREWTEQEVRKEKLVKAVRDNTDEFPTHLIEFVSTALRISPQRIENAPWEDVVNAFYTILTRFPVIDLPITSGYAVDTESKRESWDYPNRTWNYYSHLLASHYGWTLEYISQLQVYDALARIQEILTDEQLDREFTHSLSEIAYPYDQSTKKSHYKPLPRPPWMRPAIKEVKRYKIPASYLPVGMVNYESIPENLRPQEIKH